jgi:hypothetical protein
LLKAALDSINGTNERCLIYYYYFPNIDEKFLTVLKEEIDSGNETIDYVANTPFNGWIERKIRFFVEESNFKV